MIAVLIFSLQFKPVQTYVAKKAAAYLSKELHTTISLSGIYLKPFKSVVIEDLMVLDLQHDTLLNTPRFLIDLNLLSIKQRIVDVNTVQINDGRFFLKSYANGDTNLDFIINYFDSGTTTPVKKKKPYNITFDRIILNNIDFRYKNLKYKDTIKGVNFDDAHLTQFNGIFENLNTKDHLLQANIKNLNFKEKSGFQLKNLTAYTTIDTNAIELKNLLLVTNQSRLKDYFRMKFNSFKDFNSYITKVRMKANFKDSHLSSHDIAYFAPEMENMKLDIDVDGEITGLVNDLKAKKLLVKAGKATYIKGDFILKGLPNLNDTYMDLKIAMAGTNRKDLDDILSSTTGKKVKLIPPIIEKFGNINFNGSFTGFQNDFIAYGEFKTKIGRIVSDVNMKIDKKGVPSYSGKVQAYDFNIGNLLDEQSLGKVSATVSVQGVGTEIRTLKEKIDGKVDYIDFNDYRYRNALIKGTFDKRLFDGSLKVNDKNIQLVFDGSVNLNPKLPVFNFQASIKNAKLKALKLFKDSLKVDAEFKTNFSGDNLNNIQGDLRIERIRLDNVKGIYNIDSVYLKAQGLGADRALTINSDVFDASIKGQYDLNTIPSYYKALAKTYIPSLKTDVRNYNDQIFQFNLQIKRFAPVAQLIAPGLEIDEQALLIGNFDSRNNIATLNGFVKKLKYNGITANNIIIDENTTTKQLQAIITSDRVDINDSLYIKNVNISNILRNDSLALNVKLSNADDANQLDLNGLVEFASDTTARVSILPSTLKINSEDWKIQEKVRISFIDGKTEISNFDLSNGTQLLTIDGKVSNDPADAVIIGFKNFNLKTFNPFTRGYGVKLGGNLNGGTSIYGVLKSPRVSDNITIDSLTFNDSYIGSLVDTSSFNQVKDQVNIYTRILTDDKETFKIDGGLDLKEKQIDLTVKMNDSKLAVLEPFVKDLVSNLRGNISSDITVKGPLSKPEINGDVSFDEGQLTVNYLKTAYTISQKVRVENSVVQIEDLKLKDVDGNIATANGTVNLNDLNNPNLDIDISARNFMALNTTAKDNPLYFGLAYATGTFKFKGPTNKMFIGIDAKTEKGTVFNLPLNSSETVSSKDFITFVSKDTANAVKPSSSFDGLTMSFKLSVDPNTTCNLFTNLGNLSGKGNAELSLEINSFGDFEMSGDYIIESGSFDFTAQEVINKKFTIRQGGSIRWTGNPLNAQIQLKAVYSLRASLADLYTAANRDQSSSANDRVLTEVEMGLSGLLLKPDIKLDIFFPSNPGIKEEFQAYFNDSNNLDIQAFSLIIRRSFAPGTGKDFGQQITSGVTSTATELLFNQFNNVLSSLNLDFVDINVRSFSEANASFKFFNDRIVLNAGIVDRRSNNDLSLIGFSKNNVGGEVEILALIKRDGSLVGKLANKPPTQQSVFINSGINQNTNVTSLGLIYTQQFDTFREFLQKVTGQYKRNQKKKAEEQAQKEKQLLNKEAVLENEKNQKIKKN
ncbi:translocation/assembly module TamB domain-containing protein [Pedobacter duraquae]|uniref:translocation/assembly module TamB domain-containing protein n=1 Tax=Pedobacter duraquae TaxID=425511 RepID=UPI001FB6F2B5|nr:translocation/assembly module TamB domain-containing protein [Pedobacter duraquae]